MLRNDYAAISAPRKETPAERRARCAPINDAIWGEGNWVECDQGCVDSYGNPAFHSKKMHDE